MREMAEADLAAMRADTRARVAEVYAGLTRARNLAALYRNTVLPQAEATASSALAAYRVGGVDFMTLLDNRMAVNQYRQELFRLEAEEGQSWAELEMLLGRQLFDAHTAVAGGQPNGGVDEGPRERGPARRRFHAGRSLGCRRPAPQAADELVDSPFGRTSTSGRRVLRWVLYLAAPLAALAAVFFLRRASEQPAATEHAHGAVAVAKRANRSRSRRMRPTASALRTRRSPQARSRGRCGPLAR